MTKAWIKSLINYVEVRPCVILRFDKDEWKKLHSSRWGLNEFTIARPHELFSGVRVPTICFIFGRHLRGGNLNESDEHYAYMGIISSCSPITTLQTRIKIKQAVKIIPDTENELGCLLHGRHANDFRRKRALKNQALLLSPKLSGMLITVLADIQSNHDAIRTVAESLNKRRYYHGIAELQEDAVQTALKAFGLGVNARASKLDLSDGKETALARIPIIEDSVIGHDARSVPQHTLIESDITGRAIFCNDENGEELEVFTANRCALEKVFGVDLIYLNLAKQNIVMVQYKMLEPDSKNKVANDWIYRPDKNMADEVLRMKRFTKIHMPGPLEYRLNPEAFYLKFVKRDGATSKGGIITPLSHYECLLLDPKCKGPRGAIKISYNSLGGRYLRQAAFIDLIHSGYIGAYAGTTKNLVALIESVLNGNRAVVAAIERHVNFGDGS